MINFLLFDDRFVGYYSICQWSQPREKYYIMAHQYESNRQKLYEPSNIHHLCHLFTIPVTIRITVAVDTNSIILESGSINFIATKREVHLSC